MGTQRIALSLLLEGEYVYPAFYIKPIGMKYYFN